MATINASQKQILAKKKTLEHLENDALPIMACIGTREDFEKEPGLTSSLGCWGENRTKTIYVDYWEYPQANFLKGIKNAGEKTYAISEINDFDKFSLRYKSCMGIVVAGKEKMTEKNISFFSHLDSTKILPEGKIRNHFLVDINVLLKEIQERSVYGTIDAVIFGGNYLDSDNVEKNDLMMLMDKVEFEKNYRDFVYLLSDQIFESLGFRPTIIAGPKTITGCDDVIYDNDHRRLYVRRPKIGETSSESFISQDLCEEMEEKWRKEWE
jgi:hypothetical protein